MHPNHREPVLAGLVSRAAQDLYSKLQAHGSLRVGNGPNEIDPHCPPAVELLDAGVAFRCGDGDEWIQAVSPATALQLLLEAQHQRLAEIQGTILNGWERLRILLPTTVGNAAPPAGIGVDLIDQIPEIARAAAELYHTAKHRMRGTETGAFSNRITERRVFVPPKGHRVRYQMIYQSDYASTPTGASIIRRSAAADEEIRLRLHVPMKMLHIDDTIALVGMDRAASRALLVRAPALVAALGEWFDLMWADDASLLPGTEHAITDEQRHLIRLLYKGMSDEAIAKKLNLSVSTVGRKVRAMCAELGVTGRFAAGAAAAKRGWL